MRITTNNHHREFLYRADVPADVLEDQFDHVDSDDGFFKYKGTWYHVSDFMRLPESSEWHGAHAWGVWGGVVIRLADDGETYQVGRKE